MTKKENAVWLSASFCADAMLKTDLASVKRLMSGLPEAKLIAEGLTLSFLLTEAGRERPSALVEFRSNSISYTFYFTHHSKRTRSGNLMKFFSILSYLKGAYEVRINSLYAPIMETIGDSMLMLKEDENADEVQLERIAELSKSNLVLAGELRLLAKRHGDLEKREEVFREFCMDIMQKFSHGSMSSTELAETLDRLGIGGDAAKEILKMIVPG